MGLLSRAGGKPVSQAAEKIVSEPASPENDFALDEMGKALRERLIRLPQKKSTPYTILSLLKAYGAFQTGMCLSLKNGAYYSYASIGLGIEKMSFPRETIWFSEKARDRYFKLDSRKSLNVENAEKNISYWVFPLDSSRGEPAAPWEAVMILGAQDSSGFNPEPVSTILEDVSDKLLLQARQGAAEPDSGETAPEETWTETPDQVKSHTLEEEITLFHQTNLDFSCIVLENPGTAESNSGEKAGFCKKVSAVIGNAGTVVPLPSDRPLILLPIVMDRELIAHRLSKTLNTRPLLSFESNNPENVFTRIDSLA